MFAADEVEKEFGDGGTAALGAECSADPCAVEAVLVLSDVEDTVEPGMHLVIEQTRAISFRNSFWITKGAILWDRGFWVIARRPSESRVGL